jgi:hypothetical protein
VIGIPAVVIMNIRSEAGLEWNPIIRSDTEVFGTWADRNQTVILSQDHTFRYQSPSKTIHGTWSRYDWNLELLGDGFSDKMRFVQFRGDYRLMTNPPGDPDMWNGDLGLKHLRDSTDPSR